METPFVVEIDLASPIIIDRGINLAGLLARLIADRGERDPLPLVPLASRGGIFLGSDLFVLGPSLAFSVPYVRSLRPTSWEHHLALHDRRRKPLSSLTLRDERKNLLDRRSATSAATVIAFGTGDAAAVAALLDGLDHIGAKRSSGYGEVLAVRVAALDHPHAGLADRSGAPVRAVPVELWRGLNLPPRPVRNLVARLPRWASPYEPCVGPREWTMDVEAFDREVSP